MPARRSSLIACAVVFAVSLGQSSAIRADPVRDAASAVESTRPKIIERLVEAHAAAMLAHGVPLDAFRGALWQLTSEQLLAASLADSPEEVNSIVASALSGTRVDPKDGSGFGANSWIGYTAGGNVASGTGSAVAAGTHNVAGGANSFIGAGTFNAANGQGSFVGAGTSNVANATSALVIGGFDNQATVIDALVVAGAGNRATGARSVVVGGGYNLASGQWSFVGGGGRQSGSGAAGADPHDNVASGDWSTIPGGQGNRATSFYDTVGGGYGNTASGGSATVAGGGDSGLCGGYSRGTVPCANAASGSATVGGGLANVASGTSSMVGGGFANLASGFNAVVPGGIANIASGFYSFATGAGATADQDGCAVLAFWSTGLTTSLTCLGSKNIVRIGADHGFSVDYHTQRLDGGGTRWVSLGDGIAGSTIATWNGASLTDAGVWVNASSSKAGKTDFAPVDAREVLERVAQLPITTWRYKEGEAAVRHIGPMAEDFWSAFHIGYGERTIADLDARGVALSAIQGLKQALDEKTATIDALQRRLDGMDALLQQLAAHARIAAP